jgi:hypothetical protein
MRRIAGTSLAVLCGLVVLLGLLVPSPLLGQAADLLLEGALILGAFALLLGMFNLLRTHAAAIAAGDRRGSSLLLIIALLGTLALGLAAPQSRALDWVFAYIYFPLQASLGALLAFVAVRAAFRAFRLRSLDAGILLVASLVMLLLQVPAASALWPQAAVVRDWLLAVPIAASMRGVLLGVSLGIMATSLRILLAVDHPYSGEQE